MTHMNTTISWYNRTTSTPNPKLWMLIERPSSEIHTIQKVGYGQPYKPIQQQEPNITQQIGVLLVTCFWKHSATQTTVKSGSIREIIRQLYPNAALRGSILLKHSEASSCTIFQLLHLGAGFLWRPTTTGWSHEIVISHLHESILLMNVAWCRPCRWYVQRNWIVEYRSKSSMRDLQGFKLTCALN